MGLASFCAVGLTGLGNWLQDTAPEMALVFDPFNADARVNRLAAGFGAPDVRERLPELRAMAHNLIHHAPIDARGYSLLGEAWIRSGDEDRAQGLFEAALAMSQTEIHALLRTFSSAVAAGDMASAIDRLDIIFRRWPERFEALAPSVPALLRDPAGYRAALQALRRRPPWRRRFLGVLNRDPAGPDLAFRLHLDLGRPDGLHDPAESGDALRALVRARQYERAFHLFMATLPEREMALSGTVFNGSFAAAPSPRPFDWTIRSTAGVSASREEEMGGEDGGASLVLRFRGRPVKHIAVSQHVSLGSGDYRLFTRVSSRRLVAPKGLFWRLECIDPRAQVARIDIPARALENQTLDTGFRVEPGACGLFRLHMGTDLIAESFRYGYSGILSVHEIRIEKVAG